VLHSRIVVAAHGDGALREIEHAPVDAGWNPDRSRAVRMEADALLIGFGFVPRVQLAQMAGCRLEWRPEVGGWTPVRDENLATTVDGVYAAGDGAGVAGALVAESEGRLAGLAAAHRLGALDAARFAALRAPIVARLRRLAPIRRALDAISLPRPGLAKLVDDATTVCRCEDVAWRDVREAVRAGCTTYRSLKVATRVGMGACQGCSCWPGVARLVAAETKGSPESAGPANPRPPVRPVTLGELAESRIAP
jgi:NAD(P)H-nitrite reductase large subunit